MLVMRKLLPIVILSIISLLVVSCQDNTEQPIKHAQISDGQPKFEKEGELSFLKPDGAQIVKINIEVADDEASRQQGLMNRSFMSNEQGMLFIFDKQEPQAFWMRNTIISLDIIYVNTQKEIVSIVEDAAPFSDRSLPSKGPAIYVVEVNGGFCAQHGIASGDKIDFTTK